MLKLLYWFIFLLFLPLYLSKARIDREPRLEKPTYYVVTMTTYSADSSQTDDTPNETASGYIIDGVRKHRIIAVSHDLKRKFKWGSKVRLENAGRFNGVYRVHDLMNSRWKMKIDVLIDADGRHTTKKNVKLYPVT